MSDTASKAATKSVRQHRTLQSGFSLMARGEPKIWLTGGMLVVCLSMILGLLGLILINGLATFWPGRVQWLMLANHQMDIGQPQRTEARSAPAGDRAAAELSRFYRTANYDITQRHYRWFEAEELGRGGIVEPEWALVIERLSWGQLYGLPSRLVLPLVSEDASEELKGLSESQSLLDELSSELEAIATTSVALPAEGLPAEGSTDTALANATLSADNTAQTSPLAPIQQLLRERRDRLRSDQLRSAAQKSLPADRGQLQVQAHESESWQSVTDPQVLQSVGTLHAARTVLDDPRKVLEQIHPILARLAQQRHEVEDAMHSISLLDQHLSDARVGIRQAELDTGRNVLDKVDTLSAILENIAEVERLAERIDQVSKCAASDLADDDLAAKWRSLLSSYREQTLAPRSLASQDDLAAWKAQFASEPAAIRQAIDRYEQIARQTIELKRPLEAEIQSAELHSAGHELHVIVPTDAEAISFSAQDSVQLSNGLVTATAQAVLNEHSLQPLADTLNTERLNDQVTVVSFIDSTRGRQTLWSMDGGAVNSPSVGETDAQATAGSVWLLPPTRPINCGEIVRIFAPNQLSVVGKLQVYLSRWSEFLLDQPREANTEGGVFPAIWGTVVMTLIMTLAVVPFGVIAALYLREYTRSGPIVSLVRISINNLAGVPSIVYGVFGLAFFCYSIGAFIDGGAKNAKFGRLPPTIWYLTLAATVAIGVAAIAVSVLSSGPEHLRSSATRVMARVAPLVWLLSLVGAGVLIFNSPFFDGFYEARLPAPTFGKEGLLWASLTMALLTLPVVIVATEEALSAVPNSLREGSLACGASKWQTIYRIVLPHARPGILTGAILAMARGVGEVAPLMLVGALPVAPDLPLDSQFPYFHGSRSFMHLGYQIYWLGFQSQNSEASKPLVFTCTLLLILIVVSLNLSAILLRARLRRRFMGNQF